MTSEADFSNEEKLTLESHLVLATSGPLCLDPNPEVGRRAINAQHRRHMWNTTAIRRQMKKYSQVAINRKRKTDQWTQMHGLELHDHITRVRQKQRQLAEAESSKDKKLKKSPKVPADIVKPIRTASLEYPKLSVPHDLKLNNVKIFEQPKLSKDYLPLLVEEHVLETDRGTNDIYHIKLSIYQRPANSEFIGELYVDRNYKANQRNGEACKFSLGTRAHANKYIQQFTQIFTEEGRKSVRVTYKAANQKPVERDPVSIISRLQQQHQTKHQLQQQQQQHHHIDQQQKLIHGHTNIQQKSHIQQNLQQQQQLINQQILTTQPVFTSNSLITNLNASNINTLPGNQVISNTSSIIGIANIQPHQPNQHMIRTQHTQQQHQAQQKFLYSALDPIGSGSTVQISSAQLHHISQPTHLSITNGSLVMLQQSSSGNITSLTMTNPQQQQQALASFSQGSLQNPNVNRSALAASVPVLVSFFF